MHSIDLNKYNYRTDLVIEKDEKRSSNNVFKYDKGIKLRAIIKRPSFISFFMFPPVIVYVYIVT